LTNKTVQENIPTKHNSKKQTTQNTPKQNYPNSVASLLMTLGQKTRVAYSTTPSIPHRASLLEVAI